MLIDERLSNIIRHVYEAIDSTESWQRCVEDLYQLLDLRMACLWLAEKNPEPKVSLNVSVNEPSEAMTVFDEYYINMVPESYWRQEQGRIFQCEKLMPAEFYNGYYLPYDYGFNLSAVVWESRTAVAHFCLIRPFASDGFDQTDV